VTPLKLGRNEQNDAHKAPSVVTFTLFVMRLFTLGIKSRVVVVVKGRERGIERFFLQKRGFRELIDGFSAKNRSTSGPANVFQIPPRFELQTSQFFNKNFN
jgi:hypothetical protein